MGLKYSYKLIRNIFTNLSSLEIISCFKLSTNEVIRFTISFFTGEIFDFLKSEIITKIQVLNEWISIGSNLIAIHLFILRTDFLIRENSEI